MRKSKGIFVGISFLMVIFISSSSIASEKDNDGRKTAADFNASIKAFPYEASKERIGKVTKKFPELKLGMTKEEVQKILGEPDFVSYIRMVDPTPKFMTCKWVYYFYKSRTMLTDPAKDKVVQVLFDEGENVNQLIPINVTGLTPQGTFDFGNQ